MIIGPRMLLMVVSGLRMFLLGSEKAGGSTLQRPLRPLGIGQVKESARERH
jgi:hypothetical protein